METNGCVCSETRGRIGIQHRLRRVLSRCATVGKGELQDMKNATENSLAILDLSAYASASEDRIALIDSDGNIVGVNEKWLVLAEQADVVEQTGPGINYLDVCRRASASSHDAQEALSGIRAV